MAHPFNPSTLKAVVGGSLCVREQPGLQSELQNIQGYTEKTHHKKKKQKQNKREGSNDSLDRGMPITKVGLQIDSLAPVNL